MTGLTMTDCSVADNVTQARYEWDRAAVSPESVQGHFYAAWALKWGAYLLEVAAEHAGDGRDLEAELDNTVDELRDAEVRIKELTDAIKSAISQLESEL